RRCGGAGQPATPASAPPVLHTGPTARAWSVPEPWRPEHRARDTDRQPTHQPAADASLAHPLLPPCLHGPARHDPLDESQLGALELLDVESFGPQMLQRLAQQPVALPPPPP